jgi:hypothetical protein
VEVEVTGMQTIQRQTPKLRRWSRREYHRMADLGFFQNQRVDRQRKSALYARFAPLAALQGLVAVADLLP